MNPILFKNARLIDPTQKMDRAGDLLVENGLVAAVGSQLPAMEGADVIDCKGAVLAPGLCDLHVHFRDPGQTAKETLETGCAAAAAGGFTAVVTMANTTPAVDSSEAIRDCIERSRTMDCRIYPAGAVTKGLKGHELTDFA
ncbi:MAG: amidohydrolase family protein, partial [Pyramidobacter sp.]|nr:amidohydrolase family protein [Pyramidobacter sp.]